MKITELAVKRPVTTIMFFTGLIIMGVISLTRTPRELLPAMSYPQITVLTRYEAATPDEIERQITTVLEDAVGTVSGLQGMESISRDGMSMIIAEFMWGMDMNVASMEVREKIDLVKERLPRESKEPVVVQFNPFELPVVTLILSRDDGRSDAEHLYELRETAGDVIKNNLEKIENVAAVEVRGGREREILVTVNQDRIRAADISLLEVVDTIGKSNMTYPAGTIDDAFYEYLIKTDGEYKSVEDIRNTPLKVQYRDDARSEQERLMMQIEGRDKRPEGLIFLSNVATVEDTFKDRDGLLRYQGREAVAIDVQRQSGSNIVRVANDIRDELENIRQRIPDEYNLELVYDQSEYIDESIKGIGTSALLGSFLAFIVLYFFLRSMTNSAVVATAIPVSLGVTFIFIYFFDISLNMMSLGGLALGIGMLVDSSIVVLENVFRYNENNPGMPIQNAIDGTGEVTGAITSSTLTTITVFFPFVFIAGVAGQLFKELAYTVTFSLIASLLVAVTLIPRMASGIKHSSGGEPAWSGKLKEKYKYLLEAFLNKSGLYLSVIFIIFSLCMLYLVNFAGQEFIPRVGGSQFMLNVEMPFGTSLSKTDEVVQKIEHILNETEDVISVTSSVGEAEGDSSGAGAYTLMGSHQAEIVVMTEPGSARHLDNIVSTVRRRVERDVPEADVDYVTQAGVLGDALGGDAPISVDISGEDLNVIVDIAEKALHRMREVPYLYGVTSSFRGYSPEFTINVNRDRASLYNISAQNITMTAQTAIKGYVATEFKDGDEEVDVRVRLARGAGGSGIDEGEIGRILVRSPFDYDVSLNQVASFGRDATFPEILRKEAGRTVSVTSNFSDVSFGRALGAVENIVDDLRNEYSDYIIEITGERKKMQESFSSLIFVIILSILFVYMIMASQFESFWQPFIVIFTLPLSFIGVAIIMFMTGTQLSVIVLLGIIMLGGIVVNNGIVLISHYNSVEEREQMNLKTAVEASSTRLRPVLMTAVTTILGLIPMAVAGGEGAEFRAPLAITVIGGLLISTFLTLFVVPAVYFHGRKYIKKTGEFIRNAGW